MNKKIVIISSEFPWLLVGTGNRAFLLPLVGFQVVKSWHLANTILREGSSIEKLKL